MAESVFHDDNVKQFAEAWFYALDIHASTETCEAFLAGEDLKMIFPEQTLHGLNDFRAWYAGGTYSDGSSAPGVMNIFFDEIHTLQSVAVRVEGDTATADVVVGWQASWFTPPAAKSKRTAMDATQQWQLRECSQDKNPYGIEIISYNAMSEPFKYAPGFSRL
jgi:hypothetical protein